MSWFSELTSKAEAMLVKLDQDAAQALQNPDGILRKAKLLDQAFNTINDTHLIEDQETESLIVTTHYADNHESNQPNKDGSTGQTDDNQHSTIQIQEDQLVPQINILQSKDGVLQEPDTINHVQGQHRASNQDASPKISNNVENPKLEVSSAEIKNGTVNNYRIPVQDTPIEYAQQTRKFKLQTSKLRSQLVEKRTDKSQAPTFFGRDKFNANGTRETLKGDLSIPSPDANDIRASINRSLQEYKLSSSIQIKTRDSPLEQTAYTSHFDNQPNLVQHSPLLETNCRLPADCTRSSSSFSIDVPDNYVNENPSSDIAGRLIRQTASKRKSAFSLHQVINRLANHNGQSNAIIDERTKMKLRRAQMRAASYARRLNYYFRAYPTMKYWMLGYIVIMQILVVYVLFFYQSSGSSTYLTSQIKQQQDVLTESQLNSEKNPALGGVVHSASLRK